MANSAKETAQDVLDRARGKADSAEVLLQESETRSVQFQDNALKSVNTKAVRGVGLRVIHNGRIGFSCTNNLDLRDELVEQALASAAFGREARFAFPGPSDEPQVKIHDPKVCELTMEEAAATMRSGIERIHEKNADAHCSGGVSRTTGHSVLCNTAGLLCEERTTDYSLGLEAFLVRGESFLWVGEGEESCRLQGDMLKHADKVNEWIGLCEREVRLDGETLPVLFTPRALETLLGTFLINVNGKMVEKGASLLTEKMGERILDARVTLMDDPLVDYASSSYALDAEGLPGRTKPLFENGILRNFVHDLQTAGQLNVAPTGNGLRNYSSQPRPGTGNVRMKPGEKPLKELFAGVKRGLLIDQALGAGQSNVLAGDFSVSVELGFLIENGEISARVKDSMLAGNCFDAFNKIRGISQETEWHDGAELPTVCFEALSVVGRGE